LVFLNKILNYLYRIIINNNETDTYLVKNTAYSFGIQIISIVIIFINNIFFTRLFGATVYGNYTYIFSWIILISALSTLGLDELLVREVSAYKNNEKQGSISLIVSWATKLVIFSSAISGTLFLFVIYFFNIQQELQSFDAFVISLLAIPIIAILYTYQSTMQGLKKIILGQLPEKIIRPLFFLIFLLGYYLLFNKKFNDVLITLVSLNLLAFALSTIFILFFVYKYIIVNIRDKIPLNHRRKWVNSALLIFFINSIAIINTKTDILMIGFFEEFDQVGIYNVALKLSQIIFITIFVINIVIAPLISQLYTSRQMAKLQKLINNSALFMLVLSVPITLVLIIFNRQFLAIFGIEFISGSNSLIILCIGQLINILGGSVGNILIMTRHEKESVKSMIVSVVINIVLNATLIPHLGIDGAAYATVISIFTWNTLMLYYVYKRTGLNATAFYFRKKHNE